MGLWTIFPCLCDYLIYKFSRASNIELLNILHHWGPLFSLLSLIF
uniref:Uncharacterized protein n=1 Tax=Rhizophora mucronata TaxID=61149 RepID=A0A2P2P8X6_RHIMU